MAERHNLNYCLEEELKRVDFKKLNQVLFLYLSLSLFDLLCCGTATPFVRKRERLSLPSILN